MGLSSVAVLHVTRREATLTGAVDEGSVSCNMPREIQQHLLW
jgi:hypothetical protein